MLNMCHSAKQRVETEVDPPLIDNNAEDDNIGSSIIGRLYQMGIRGKVEKVLKINIPKFLYYNFFCSKVERQGKGFLVPYWHTIIEMKRGSKIILHDGHFEINYFSPRGSKAEAYIRMAQGTVLEIFDTTQLCYHSTIELHQNAKITIGSAYINSGAVILAADNIGIGKDVLISRETFIYDSDHHPIVNENDVQLNPAKPVIIEDHVWIGLKCLILRGSRIGTGAMIAANSLVGGKIKPGTMASGNPARSYSEIRWKKNL